jgi:oligoendopeptidase F
LAGYDSYGEYVFSYRPLSLAEVEAFIADVKQTILPVYQELIGSVSNPYLACPAEGFIEFAFRTYGFGSDQRIYKHATQVLRSTLDEMNPLIDYLERSELLDVMPREEKDDQLAATFNLYGYQIPFVIMPTPDIDTLIHESGHALELYLMPEIDLIERFEQTPESAEISSTCMEVLATLEFERLFGETADYARMAKKYYMTSILLWASLQCEFELALYARPEMTQAERDALFAELLVEYCMDSRMGGFQWQGIHHYFEDPLYVVSYTLAGVVALELWRVMEGDTDRAKAIYLGYLRDNMGQDFITRLGNAGLGNPAKRENLEELARFLDELYSSEAYLSP